MPACWRAKLRRRIASDDLNQCVNGVYPPHENPVLAEDADQAVSKRFLITFWYHYGDGLLAVENRLVFTAKQLRNGRGVSMIGDTDGASCRREVSEVGLKMRPQHIARPSSHNGPR